MSKKFVANIIGEDYKTWNSQKPVIIHAPTGSGKTHFILNVLLPYVQSLGKRLVYIANRSALEQQVERDISDEYRDSIVTCSYQQLPYLYAIRTKKNPDKRKFRMDAIASADYYVLDEAHYFLADSNFNTKVESCFRVLDSLKRKREDSVWIYMTATIAYLLLQLQPPRIDIPYLESPHYYSENHFKSVKSLLRYKETRREIIDQLPQPIHPYEIASGNNLAGLYSENLPSLYIFGCFKPNYFADISHSIEYELHRDIKVRYHYYQIESDYSYIDPVFFDKWDDIINAIANTPSHEKWIIFVTKESTGDFLLEKLIESGYTDAVFISAKRRKNKRLTAHRVFQEIVEDASFHQRILISTKVLDNGVNLKDSALHHMVMDSFDETTFLQFVGRKRQLNKDDYLHLYLKNAAEEMIRRKFRNQILQITCFWYNLLMVRQSNRNPQYFVKINAHVQSRYLEDGNLKYPFGKYVEAVDMALSPVQNQRIKDDPALFFDMYRPAVYSKRKLTYDYYKMMAAFERAQNDRFRIADKRGIDTEEKYEQIAQDLKATQFFWLKQQLSWIGLNDEDHDPSNPKHWITSQLGQTSKSSQELVAFLSSFESGAVLSISEEESLKELFRNWIQNVRPRHKDANSKGSIAVINRCFEDQGVPFRIKSKKKMIAKAQRNWWIIEKL